MTSSYRVRHALPRLRSPIGPRVTARLWFLFFLPVGCASPGTAAGSPSTQLRRTDATAPIDGKDSSATSTSDASETSATVDTHQRPLTRHPLLRYSILEENSPRPVHPARSDEREIVSAAINHPDFKNFGSETNDGESILVLRMDDAPEVRGLVHGEDRVILLSEEACRREMITQFFELKDLIIQGDRATVTYSLAYGSPAAKSQTLCSTPVTAATPNPAKSTRWLSIISVGWKPPPCSTSAHAL